jgi:hypothetical protein
MLLGKKSPVPQRNLLPHHLGRSEDSQAKYWYCLLYPENEGRKFFLNSRSILQNHVVIQKKWIH